MRQGVRRGPWEALDPVLDPQASGRGQHGGERVRRLAKRVRAAEDAETRFRVLAQHQRKRLDRRLPVEPTPESAIPEHERRMGTCGGRPDGRRSMGATTMLGAFARALRARGRTASPWHRRAAARSPPVADRLAPERRERAGGSPRSARRPGRAARARRVPARSSRARERTRPATGVRAQRPRRRDPAGRRPRRGPVRVRVAGSATSRRLPQDPAREGHLDAVAAQFGSELAVAESRTGRLNRVGVSRRRRDHEYLRQRPQFRRRRWSSSATLAP